MQATRGAVVTFNYTLTDDKGELLDKADDPVEYLHGYDNIIPGLEKGLEGAGPGDHRDVTVEPADAYGEPNPDAITVVSSENIPDDMELKPGMRIVGETDEGPVGMTVVEVNDDNVVVDANHPLAGKRLHFDVEVVDVRAASEEELAQGYPEEPETGDGARPGGQA